MNLKVYNDQTNKSGSYNSDEKLNIRAEERHTDMYAAVDLIVDKLERQIRKHKTKVNRKFREREGIAAFFAQVETNDIFSY